MHPDAELTLLKLYATEGFVGTGGARRQSEPVRQVSYQMLSRRIGGPNDANGLDHFGAYAYYAGPQSLSLPRDNPTGVTTRLMQCSLARGNALGVPGSTYNPSLAAVTAQKSAEIFRRATAEPDWVITYHGLYQPGDRPRRHGLLRGAAQ